MNRHKTSLFSLVNLTANLKTIRKRSIALFPMVAVAIFFLLSHGVEASNKFWIATTPGNFNDAANWSLSSGGPPNTTAPGASDVAFFDGNGLGSCTIAANTNVGGINIGSGYSGTIAVASGITLTVGGNGFSQSAGTFNGGNSNIDVDGNFLITGTGVFNSTTGTLFLGSAFDHNTSSNPGGTFNHNNGTVTFDGSLGGINSELSGATFNNVNFDHTSQRTINIRSGGGPTITVLGALALNDGELFGNQIEARAALTISPNFDGAPVNHATLVIANGGGARIMTFAAGIKLLNVILNDSNATIQTSGSGTLNWRMLTLQAGTINQGSVDFVFPPVTIAYSQSGGTFNASGNSITFQGAFNQSGGTFNGSSSNIDLDGDFALQGTGIFNSTTGTLFVGRGFDHDTVSFPGGTFNHNNGTVVFDGAGNGSLNVSAAGETFSNLTFMLPELGQRGLSGGPFIALGTLTLNNGTLFGGALQPRGNVVIANTFDGGTGAITFSGPNDQTFSNNGGSNPTGTWTIDKTSGRVSLLTDLILGTSQALNVASGTLDLSSSFDLTAGSITIGGAGTLRNLGSGDLTLGVSLSNAGVFNFNGGTTSCGDVDPIFIRSSAPGVARPWSGAGAFSIVDVDVKDQNAAAIGGGLPVFNSTNSGNNVNWVFGICPVVITTQPTSQSVCPGVSVNFMVSASGSPGLTFQWRKNGVNLTNGGNISGATTTTLTINPVGPADHASYDVVVTNTFGVTAASTAAALTVAGVVTTTANSGPGSLRQAILDVNSCAGLNTIAFNIPAAGVQTITPLSALPTITDPIIIDGTTQPGFAGSPVIELNGASAGVANGLLITAGGSTVKGLVINRFNGDGIEISGNGANTIQGCYIGTNAAGTAQSFINNFGVFITNAPNNVIGGTTPAERNIISGCGSGGVAISGSSATGNHVKGNFLGTDVTGTLDLGNTNSGMSIQFSATNNLVGGTTTAERNIISGNGSSGIFIGSNNNQVKGNFIGTSVTGTAALPNGSFGVDILFATNIVIGGMTASEGNLISGNALFGISIGGGSANQVKGNFIGTDVTGTVALPNGSAGMIIGNSANNLIGGTTAPERNIISGNGFAGIFFSSNSTNNDVKGNFIGTDVSGTADLGNLGEGVLIDSSEPNASVNNKIGGVAAGESNVIAFNSTGVKLFNNTGTIVGNAIRANAIFDNDNLGIDLGPAGVTPNDAGDGDTGTNLLQNFPSIVSANSDAASIVIQASLSSTPNTFFNVDFYSSPTADPTGFGEGKVFLGSRPAATQDDGEIVFTATFNTVVTLGHFITATATDLAGNTSEFSLAHVVSDAGACATLELVPSQASFNDAGGSGLINVTKAAGCAWTAVSNASWITNVAPASGSGNGAVTYAVTTNTSGCRSGTITVGGRTFTVTQSCPTAIELISFKAESYDAGTFIEWRTGFEAHNLGFNIYRDEGGKRTLLNSQIVAGSALTAGSTLRAGRTYTWWNDSSASGATYWLEDFDLKGQSTLLGPFYARVVGGKVPARSAAAFLSEVGRRPDHKSSTLDTRAPLVRLSAAQLARSADIATRPAVKIAVTKEGWYRVTQAELVAAGLDPVAVDARFLQVFVDGEEQPIIVSGEEDGRLDAQDFLEFYGTGLESPFSASRVYWLLAGDQPGVRVTVTRSEGVPTASRSFMATVERRDRSIYFAALRNGESENFFGAVIASGTVEQELTLSNLAGPASGNAHLEVALQGVTHVEHRVGIELNGDYAGEVTFVGQNEGVAKFTLPHRQLNEGINQVRLTPLGGQGDVSLVNYIRISYEHAFNADTDALKLLAAGGERITVDGFSSKAIRVFDVTSANSPQELVGEIKQQKSNYSVTFASPGKGERMILAFAGQQRAAMLNLRQPASIRNANASVLMITTRELASSLLPLVSAREQQGFSVSLINIEQIYDEFSFGQKTPYAVRDFLAFANATWKKRPRFVVLAGDASFDPKNYLGMGDADLVVSKLIDTDFLETATDDWFSDFNGDDIGDLATGRLPARTAEELSGMVSKIIRYENGSVSEEAVLVADANDGFDFEQATTDLRSLIPASLRITQVNRGRVDAEIARDSLIEAIYRKQFLVNYVGHGSVNQWRGNLLTNEEALGLRNEHLPMFVMMTCLNGYFTDPVLDSLGESLLKAEGGAVAVWGSSGMTMPTEQASVNQELYRILFDRDHALTIGEAAARAKLSSTSADVRRTWILFGDPATRLR